MLTKETCEKVLSAMLSTGGDFAEIYEDAHYYESFMLREGEVEKSSTQNQYGIGLRIYHNLSSVYSYTNKNDLESLLQEAKQLASAFNFSEKTALTPLQEVIYEDKHPTTKPIKDFDAAYKIDIMQRASKAAYAYNEKINKVTVTLNNQNQQVLIANSDGKYIKDDRTRTRLAVEAIAVDGEKMESGHKLPGAHMGLEFYDVINVEDVAREAARIAMVMLYADECPSGTMDVVIDNGFGGVIFHEACGHSLEATSVAKNQSVFANKIGEQIAATCVSAVDDGTIPNGWGSDNIDDEGNFKKRNVLIENGILKGYMIDQLNGRRMKMESTGSGRRQSYAFEPTSRMTNTFILNGESTFDEIISATKFGLYAKNLGGGSVDPSTGDFNFAVIEGYLIEDGKITKPLKGATLIGNGSSILKQIDMVGNNLSREQGMCGSVSGSIPTDVGQPTIRVKNISVGGRGGAL